MYKDLEAGKIVETVRKLQRRIAERFPEASLGRLVAELETSAREAQERSRWIRRPQIALRGLTVVVLIGGPIALYLLEESVAEGLGMATVADFIMTLEAVLGSLVFLGAGFFFIASLETRIKRSRALRVMHELRSMAHIVDMHQLTKDPERIAADQRTPSSPVRSLTPFELGRYYDYCSESLSLISKVAAVYMRGFSDPVVLTAIDEIEALCTGLSRKIWQKIMLLDQIAGRERGSSGEPQAS